MNLAQFVNKYGTDTASAVIRAFAERFLAHHPELRQELVLIADNLQSALQSVTLPEGVIAVELDNPAELHNTLASIFGE